MNYYRMAFNKYAVFDGRSRRKEYWIFTICNAVIMTITDLISPIISGLIALVIFTPWLAVAVRRMHDVDKSGWFILIPLYNLFLAWTDGTKGSNKYGPDPKAESTPSQTHETNTEAEISHVETKDKSGLTTVWLHGETTKTATRNRLVRNSTDRKFCGHCGVKNITSAKFCSSCGEAFLTAI